jgi:hypothetical protein
MTAVSSDQKFQEAFSRFMNYLLQMKNQDQSFKIEIDCHLEKFIAVYAKSFSHRLLRTPLVNRNNISVKEWLEKCQYYANEILGTNVINVEKHWSVRLSKLIDSSSVLRKLFLVYKKLFPKPVFK